MDYKKKYNEAMLRADEAVQKGCLDKDMFNIIFPPEESEDERVIRTLFSLCMDHDWLNGATKEEYLNWLKKQKESLHISESCKENADSFTDEDERIRKWLVDYFGKVGGKAWIHREFTCEQILAWLEKQKEQKPIQTDAEKEYVRTLKSLVADFVRANNYIERGYYQQIYDWLDGRHVEQKEQKPCGCVNVESEYDKGWRDGHKAGLKDAEMQKPSNFPAGFYVTMPDGKKYYTKEMRCNGMNVKVVEPKPAEWSEEDERRIDAICELLENTSAIHPNYSHRKLIIWLKSLRPSWNPSEDQMAWLKLAIDEAKEPLKSQLEELYKNIRDNLIWK